MRACLALLAAIALLVFAPAARAQCGTGGVNTVRRFTVLPTAITFPAIGQVDLDRGYSSSTTVSANIETTGRDRNTLWYFCIQGTSATFPTTSGYNKPVSDLQWSLDGTTWASVTTSVQQVRTGSGTSSTFPLYLRLSVRYTDDAPGAYGPLPLTFYAQF